MDIQYSTIRNLDTRIEQLEEILSHLIEELKAAKAIKAPKQ